MVKSTIISVTIHIALIIIMTLGMKPNPHVLEPNQITVSFDYNFNKKNSSLKHATQKNRTKTIMDQKKRIGDMKYHKNLSEHAVPDKSNKSSFKLEKHSNSNIKMQRTQPEKAKEIAHKAPKIKPGDIDNDGFTQKHVLRDRPALSSLLKNLQKTKSDLTQDEEDSSGTGNNKKDGGQLNTTEVTIIASQITKCYKLPTGAVNVKGIIIDLEIELDKIGKVIKAQAINKPIAPSREYTIAKESATRAILHPKCRTITQLSPKRYKVWKKVRIRFNPKDVL